MEPQNWLAATAHGYADLSQQERQAIADFSTLWSLFEGTRLRCDASLDAIAQFVRRVDSSGALRRELFSDAETHFVDRYHRNPKATEQLAALRFVQNKHYENVCAFLEGRNNEPVASLTALLHILYRLRINLFHGEKWAYGLRDQQGNFENASRLLMAVMDVAPAR